MKRPVNEKGGHSMKRVRGTKTRTYDMGNGFAIDVVHSYIDKGLGESYHAWMYHKYSCEKTYVIGFPRFNSRNGQPYEITYREFLQYIENSFDDFAENYRSQYPDYFTWDPEIKAFA